MRDLKPYRQPTKRECAIRRIEVAAFHDDLATCTKLFVEDRISFATYKAALAAGRRARDAGHKCTCEACGGKGVGNA